MIEILIVFLLSLIVVLLIVLIVVLLKKKSKNSGKNFNKEEFVQSIKEQQKVSITVLTLPLEIENLSNNQVRDISRKILRIFESLEYKKMQ